MSFDIKTEAEDFFSALRPLIPKVIEIAHLCYNEVLIKDGRIKKGEYDKSKGLQGLFVSELRISDERRGFELKGVAFASTPLVEDLEDSINAIQNLLTKLNLYDTVPFPDEKLSAHIVIEHMFFPPGVFSISIGVGRYRDQKYRGHITVSYDTIVYDLEEAKSHLRETAIIRTQTYEKLLQSVQKARTNNEKKESLENLVSLMVKDLQGFDVKHIDKGGIDNEVDIFVINESNDIFLKQLGTPVLIECRNWNRPMPAKAIRDFGGKLRDKNVSTGIIVSLKGVTGDENKAAKVSIRTFLSRDKIRIIVLEEEDLRKVARGESFRALLRNKYYEIMTY